jgi:hypothetical protein
VFCPSFQGRTVGGPGRDSRAAHERCGSGPRPQSPWASSYSSWPTTRKPQARKAAVTATASNPATPRKVASAAPRPRGVVAAFRPCPASLLVQLLTRLADSRTLRDFLSPAFAVFYGKSAWFWFPDPSSAARKRPLSPSVFDFPEVSHPER